jgi:hypothetical protein
VALTFVKKPKPVEELVEIIIPSGMVTTIDEIGTLQAQIAKLDEAIAEKAKDELEKREKLQKKLKPYVQELELLVATTYPSMDGDKPHPLADETFVVKGTKYQAEIGKAENKRELGDMKQLLELMGEETFFLKCKMNLADVDAYLTPDEKLLVVKELKAKRKYAIAKKV